MLASPHSGVFDATLALMAHHEWVVIMVAAGGVVTLATHPETIGNNALYDRLVSSSSVVCRARLPCFPITASFPDRVRVQSCVAGL